VVDANQVECAVASLAGLVSIVLTTFEISLLPHSHNMTCRRKPPNCLHVCQERIEREKEKDEVIG
jgi:hypothetical protein